MTGFAPRSELYLVAARATARIDAGLISCVAARSAGVAATMPLAARKQIQRSLLSGPFSTSALAVAGCLSSNIATPRSRRPQRFTGLIASQVNARCVSYMPGARPHRTAASSGSEEVHWRGPVRLARRRETVSSCDPSRRAWS